MYKHVAVGGTFDHFHKGHEHLLHIAFKSAKQVTIGITTDNLLTDKEFNQAIEPFEVRKQYILDYLNLHKLQSKATIVKINDIFGPASTDNTMDSIIATKETIKNVLLLNKKRIQNGFIKLKVIRVDFIKSEDRKIIRSGRIRKGEINSEGLNYGFLFKKKDSLILPKHLRESLRQPFGDMITTSNKNTITTAKKAISLIKKQHFPIIISVGDVVSESLTKQGFTPDIQIIDKRTQREEYLPTKMLQIPSFSKNPAGKIQKSAVKQLQKNIHNYLTNGIKSIQLIQGEEDLMALPSIILSPLGGLVLYGQSNVGIIMVKVTVQIKKKVELLLSQFI